MNKKSTFWIQNQNWMTWVTGKMFIFHCSWLLETINLATWKMCSHTGTTSLVLCTVINLNTSGLCLLCCPTFNIRVSGNISVGVSQMSAWDFYHLFAGTSAHTGLQSVRLWSQHHSAPKGWEEAGFGLWSSLTARAAKKPLSDHEKDSDTFKCSAGNWWALDTISLYYPSSKRCQCFWSFGSNKWGFLCSSLALGLWMAKLVIANWCYKYNSPRSRLSIHSGFSLGQVAWQPISVPMNSQCTPAPSTHTLKSEWDHKPGITAVLEGQGYLKVTMVVML